jgi:hypothetical protein
MAKTRLERRLLKNGLAAARWAQTESARHSDNPEKKCKDRLSMRDSSWTGTWVKTISESRFIMVKSFRIKYNQSGKLDIFS